MESEPDGTTGVEQGVDRHVDAVGLICPEPALRARKALAQMRPGALLEIVTDDPLAEVDLRILCDRGGHEWVESVETDGVRRTRIRRAGD
ncbi:sulfurtransferase TusA family protein [Halomonas denitrificans]|nr:sulfurtransferase TusA family protein [Halomonas denitrificans]